MALSPNGHSLYLPRGTRAAAMTRQSTQRQHVATLTAPIDTQLYGSANGLLAVSAHEHFR